METKKMSAQDVCDLLQEKSLLSDNGIRLAINGNEVSLDIGVITTIVNAALTNQADAAPVGVVGRIPANHAVFSATSFWLDAVGLDVGLPRHENEACADYRHRLIGEMQAALAQRVVSETVPRASQLFCDLKTDEEKANFFLSGRGYETGVIARAIQNDVAMAYQRCANYRSELSDPPAAQGDLLTKPVALSDADIALILDGLKVADALIDMIPTRLHEHADSAIGRIGESINLKGGYNAVASANRCFNKFATATKPSKNMAQIGCGSHGPNYDGNKMAANTSASQNSKESK